jgi:hypothetical protein
MEVLNSLIRRADDWRLLHHLGTSMAPFRTTLYADDQIKFAALSRTDLLVIKTIFDIFAVASGLSCNMAKCQLVPIHFSEDQVQEALPEFQCQCASFPITYLGMPLSVFKLPRSSLQPIADKMAGKLTAWKGRLLHNSGRLTLIKTTLAAILGYTAISIEFPPWLRKAMECIMKGFL